MKLKTLLGNYPNTRALKSGQVKSDRVQFDFADEKTVNKAFKRVVREIEFGKLMALAAIVRRYGGSSLRGLKPMLNAFGLPGGTLREPRLPLDAAEIDKMAKAVNALQIPGAPRLAA